MLSERIVIICIVTFCVAFFVLLFPLLFLRIKAALPFGKNKSFDIKKYAWVAFLAIGAGVVMGVSLCALAVVGIWLVILHLREAISPVQLALCSVLIAILPFVISSFASIVAKALNCRLDASGEQPCYVLSLNIAPLLYQLYMTSYFTIFSAGLGSIGLVTSLVWAILS